MTDKRKTIYVNDQPVVIFIWAEVQHCVNAFDSELYLKIQRGEAEIVDRNGDRIGWGGFAGEGQHIYVRMLKDEPEKPALREVPSWVDDLIRIFMSEAVSGPPREIRSYLYKGNPVFFVPKVNGETNSTLYDIDGNQICAPDGGYDDLGDGRCPDFLSSRTDERMVWKDPRQT